MVARTRAGCCRICSGANPDEEGVGARKRPELVEEGFWYRRCGDHCPGGHGRMDTEHRADSGKGCRADDHQSFCGDPVTLHHHRVAEFLVELRQCGGPEHDLILPVDRVTREHRWRDGCMGGLAQNRHDVVVDLDGGEIGTRRRRDGVVAGQG